MYALSFGLFRHLVRRRCVRLLSTHTPIQEVPDDLDYFETQDARDIFSEDSSRYQVTQTVNVIYEEKERDVIEWRKVNDKLLAQGIKSPSTKIFQACLRLQELSTALSYYNHLLEAGESLSIMDLMFFSKLLLINKNECKKYEPLLLKLYNDLREHFVKSPLIRQFTVDVFLEIPSCFDDIVSILRNQEETVGYTSVIEKSFELNKPDVAFEFMDSDVFIQTPGFLTHFTQFCVDRAKEGTFSPDLITRLVNFFGKQTLCFSMPGVKEKIQTLVNEVNKHQSEYRLSVKKCDVHERTDVCSECHKALVPNLLTEEDFSKLKDQFYENSFRSKNVYLTSDVSELKRFLNFLNKCHKFDIVMDTLNLLYRKKNAGVHVAARTLSYFVNKNFSLLLVSRSHSKGAILRIVNSLPPKHRNKIQMFFTSNISEDDVFILQAALHGGLNTYFLTGDSCGNHAARLDPALRKIFLKWQMTQQYVMNEKLMIVPPFLHGGLPQLTYHVKDEKYIWHLSYQPERSGRMNRIYSVEWLCLKATKRKKLEIC